MSESGMSETVTAADLRRTAQARQSAGRWDEATRLYQRAVTADPFDPVGWVALADCLLLGRRPEAALRACDDGLTRLPASPSLYCAKARVLQSLSRVGEARVALQQALAIDPGGAEARFGLARLAAEAGDWDGAATIAAPLLALAAPGARIDWLAARIALGNGDLSAAVERSARALQTPGLAPDQQAEAALLMGEALDGLGRAAEAFQAFSRGKAALRGFYAARAAGRESEVEKLGRLATWFRAADPAPWRATPPASAGGHAFLVGFPRSGTTLLEQALAGHPDVAALEEAPTFADAYAEFMSSPEGLQRLAHLSAGEAEHWRAVYWRVVADHGVETEGKLFLDKAPAGTLYLPLVAKLFPAARVLFAVRDPRDVVLSCFRSSFQMNALTYAFTDLVETTRCYAATMDLAEVYRDLLPIQPLEVRYERLVDAFEAGLARIAAFLGIEVTPGMLDVAATASRHVVRTPSAPQVRAGLNRLGLGRWRAYQAELAPVSAILAPWLERFGYGGEG